MSERLPAYEIDLFEVRKANFLKEEVLPSAFFADSEYYGATDLQMLLHLGGRYVGDAAGVSGVYYFDITLNGEATFACTRCLRGVRIPLEYDGVLEVRTTENGAESFDEEVWEIAPTRESLDIATYIRESLYLSLPMSVNHGDFGTDPAACDAQMVGYILKEEKGVSLGNICGEEFAQLAAQLPTTQNERKKKEE